MKIVCGHTFDDKNLNSDSIVIDLGANRGFFSQEIIENYNSKVIAYEPSKHLCNNELETLKNKYSEKFTFYNTKKSSIFELKITYLFIKLRVLQRLKINK